MAKLKFYAVKNGKTPGIYTTWEECKLNVDGYKGSEYKSFTTKKEAEEYLGIVKSEIDTESNTKDSQKYLLISDILKEKINEKEKEKNKNKECIAYVDGSYNKDLNIYGCGIVFIDGNHIEKMYKQGDDPVMLEMWNVAGETEAAMDAVNIAINRGYKKINIYHDYIGIAAWAENTWRANKNGSIFYKNFINNAKKNIEIEFFKVVAHTGDKYNEIADELAKTGSKI